MTPSSSRYILVSAIWATFFVFGFQLAGIGPLIATLAGRTGVTIETVGVLFTVQSLASLISAAMIGTVVERFNVRGVILFGLTCVAIGMFGLYSSQSFVMLLISGAIGGFGVAFMDVGGQLLIVGIFGDKSGRPLNALHFLFSVGAVIGPFLATNIGIDMLLVALIILIVIFPVIVLTLPKHISIGIGDKPVSTASLYRSPVLWLFAVLILLYVGLEIGIGNWTTEYLVDSTATSRESAGFITSAYWFSFMVSRLFVTAIGSRLTFERQLLMGAALSVIGTVAYLLTVGNATGAIISTLVIGFSFGPIYPATFAIVTRAFSGAAGKAAGVIGAAASIGAMSIVPLQGVLLKQSGGSTMALYLVVLAVGMLGCFLIANRGVSAR